MVLSWYLHQPESHQLSFQQGLGQTSGPRDRTPGLPGSDKNGKLVDFQLLPPTGEPVEPADGDAVGVAGDHPQAVRLHHAVVHQQQ